jgi:hypothetical protein
MLENNLASQKEGVWYPERFMMVHNPFSTNLKKIKKNTYSSGIDQVTFFLFNFHSQSQFLSFHSSFLSFHNFQNHRAKTVTTFIREM